MILRDAIGQSAFQCLAHGRARFAGAADQDSLSTARRFSNGNTRIIEDFRNQVARPNRIHSRLPDGHGVLTQLRRMRCAHQNNSPMTLPSTAKPSV